MAARVRPIPLAFRLSVRGGETAKAPALGCRSAPHARRPSPDAYYAPPRYNGAMAHSLSTCGPRRETSRTIDRAASGSGRFPRHETPLVAPDRVTKMALTISRVGHTPSAGAVRWREVAACQSLSMLRARRLRRGDAHRDAMERRKRFANRAVLLSGFGAALVACTAAEPAAPYLYYGAYGGYYGYPPGYYYPPPVYGSFDFVYGRPWWGNPWWDRSWWDGPWPQRRFSQQPQPAPPPPAHSGGNAIAPGFLGNVMRQQPHASPPASPGGAQSGGSTGQPRGFLGNVLRQRQNQ